MTDLTTRRNPARQTTAVVREPGAGRAIPGPEGLTLKASGVETGGSISVLEALTPSGFGAPRHIHHGCDELFYILAGEMDFLIGERRLHATPGTFVFIPRGTVHAPRAVGDGVARVLMAFVPGGAELAFEELSRLIPTDAPGQPPDPDAAQAVARKYDSEFVGPPI